VKRRTLRFAAWTVAVALAGCGAALARLDAAHRFVLAGAWTLAHLSAIVWMLAHPARSAIRLHPLLSEAIVLGAAPLLVGVATGRWGAATLLSGSFLIINHVGVRPLRARIDPAFGNPWRLVPSLWHPALWLVALHAPGSSAAWAGVGLVPCAHAASVLTRSPSLAVRVIAWIAWVGAGVVAACALAR